MASAASAASKCASHTAAARKTSALAQRIAALCQEFKATDITILSLKGVSDMTDYFVIASGTSDTHVRSTAQRVEDEMKREGERPAHTEGIEQGRWVILDYVDVVVHVFHPAMRSYYQLERLWGDAAVVPLKHQGASA
ncbi:MAG: ribosome silencing factor [Gemmatimonadetes bacterium]|nr:ribosome silencing factor [Gemmatimonadota bacterium]